MPATKRTSTGSAGGAPPMKSLKSGPLAQVVKGLAASDLPKGTRDMLVEMLVPSLGTYKEKRDKYQTKVVDLVGGVLAAVDESLQSKVNESETFISQGDQAKENMQQKVQANDSETTSKRADVSAKKVQLAEAARNFRSAREATVQIRKQGQSAEVDALQKQRERENLAGIAEDLEKPADDGNAEKLVKKIGALAVGESIMVALPAVLAKASSDRSSFDLMVLTSVREELDKRITAADETIQQLEPSRAANAEALQKAEVALQARKAQQMQSAEAYWKVAGEEEQLLQEGGEVRQEMNKHKNALRKHQAAGTRAKAALQAFQSGPGQAFEKLREAAEEVAEESTKEAEAEPEAEA